HLDDSDDVRLDVEESISDLTSDPPQGTLGTVNFVERGATTTLTVKDEHTVVIGGLVRDKVLHYASKVPLLGDIPILGALFRSTHDTIEKDNLVLVLTPYIVRDDGDMRRIFERRMQERQEFLDHYFVFRDGPEPGFNPSPGHGLLAEIRATHAELAERQRLEAPPPDTIVTHTPRPSLDLPTGQPGVASAQPGSVPSVPNVNVAPAVRTLDRVEK
ncbi:MAG TPA: type II secretion system protein GspD, partial [Polyangiaceae bacterium]